MTPWVTRPAAAMTATVDTAVITAVSTVAVMAAAGLVTQGVIRHSGKGKEENHG